MQTQSSSGCSCWEFSFAVNQRSQIPADVTETPSLHDTTHNGTKCGCDPALVCLCWGFTFPEDSGNKTKNSEILSLNYTEEHKREHSSGFPLTGNSPFTSLSWIWCGSLLFKLRLRSYIWQPSYLRIVKWKVQTNNSYYFWRKVNGVRCTRCPSENDSRDVWRLTDPD